MNRSKCLNCESHIEESMKFCPNCGQKNKISILGIRELLSDFFSSIFYLDSKLFNSIKTVFIPARGTKNYVAGKRKSYLNPFRIFFLSALVFFALVVSMLSDIDLKETGYKTMDTQYEKIKTYDKRQVLIDSLNLSEKRNKEFIDQLNIAYELQDIDSTTADRDTLLAKNFSANKITEKYEIKNRDLYELSLSQLYEKYKVNSYYDKFLLKLTVELGKDLKKVILYAISNFLWGVIFISILAALFLKLLYIRHSVSYVELILLLFEFHAILFIVSSIVAILINWDIIDSNNIEDFIWIFLVTPLVYFFLELKLYFRQGIIKTLFKLFIFMILYFIISLIFLLLVSLISMVFL